MTRWPLLALALLAATFVWGGSRVLGERAFPPDTTPQGAYTRIALAVAQRRPRDAFAYLETEAQWAAFTLHDLRKKALDRVRASYPPDQATPLLATWSGVAQDADGADVFATLALQRGWLARLERDLSGVEHVEIQGERATVVTTRGTRYPFRRRENGIWGLTIFTAELAADAERAARDLDVVEHAASDYDRARER